MREFPINYTLVLCLLAQVAVFSIAHSQADSLWRAYEQTEESQDKLDILGALSTEYIYNNVDSAMLVLADLKSLAQKENNQKALINYYQNSAIAYHRQTKNERALTYIDTAIQMCRQQGDSLRVASNLINKGAIYQQMGKSGAAIKVQHAVIQMMEGKEDGKKALAKALHNTGVNYSDLGLQTEALTYLFRALEIKLEDKDPISLLSTYSTIANIYQERENYQQALEYYIESIPWAEASGSQYHQCILNINMATNYTELGELDKASELLEAAEATAGVIKSSFLLMHTQLNQADLAIKRRDYQKAAKLLADCRQFSKAQQLPYGEINALLSLAELDKEMGNYASGVPPATQAMRLAKSFQMPELESDAQKLLGELYENLGNSNQALIYFKRYQAYKDSVYNAQNSQIMAGLQMQHELALQEKDFQIQLAEKEKSLETAQARAQRWYLLTIGLVALLLSVVLIFLYLNYKRQQDSKEELAQINKELYDANENLEIAYLDLASSNQELNTAHSRLQDFSFSAYHDFKESLRNIVTYSQLLRGKLSDIGKKGDIHNYITQIVKNSTGMSKLLDNLQAFSDQEESNQQKEWVDMDVIAASLKEDWDKETGPTPLDIGLSFKAPLPKLHANYNQIRQLFANLIENAVKFKKPDVPLTVELGNERHGRRVVFFVRDNGRGIKEHYHDRIFDPFFRLHGRNISGSGMGLAIVKRIVESYQGSIWIDSSEDEGTTVFFTLPAAVYASQQEGVE
jgi:signal transduction histidine kinase